MCRISARIFSRFLIIFFVFLTFTHQFTPMVFAQTIPVTPIAPTGYDPTAPDAGDQWQFDRTVTATGRNADRARQLLWWVWSHPAVSSAPVLAEVWGRVRNMVYVFIVFVIVAFGLGLILSRSRGPLGPVFSGISSPLLGINVPSVLIRLGAILLYVTFSYIIVLGLIQLSEVSMQFIKSLIGQDLFNVFFAGSGNNEQNYTGFIGYRNTNPLADEMIQTSLTVIRITSMTYYVMSIILILRTIILWFMLILSPFLALLMPFIFIRNVGWIWIGVFFQWLFYGPLMVLFVVAVVKIWVSGIPFPFDFTRINKPEGQVYKTSINILYGGPAQTLSAQNSANYVDTYAEYIIALVMLWAAMILPWLLLRIFRDYCCSLLAANNVTLNAIYERLRQLPSGPNPPPVQPSPTAAIGATLPYRQTFTDTVRDVKTTQHEAVRELSRTTTTEIARAMDLSVSKLSDVSRFELNQTKRSDVMTRLDKIASPERISSVVEREQYQAIRTELVNRASSGDKMAQALLVASEKNNSSITERITTASITKAVFAPMANPKSAIDSIKEVISDSNKAEYVARETNTSTEKVKEVLQTIANTNMVNTTTIQMTSKQTNTSESKVKEIIERAQKSTAPVRQDHPTTIPKAIAAAMGVDEKQVKSVLSSVSITSTVDVQTVKTISQKTGVSETKVKDILSSATSTVETVKEQEKLEKSVAKQVNVAPSTVKEVLAEVPASGEPTAQQVTEIAQKTGTTEAKVKEITQAAQQEVATEVAKTNEVAKKVGVSEKKVKEVMAALPQDEKAKDQQIAEVAQQTGMSKQQVKEIAESTQPAISFEDYEEVKNMWLSHYRESQVPVSDAIKDRGQWIEEEQKKLTNISNLLASSDPQMKQKGFEQVAEVLPFMLLGGFSEQEVQAYIKAKLEASKQVQTEMKIEAKVRAEVEGKKVEDEDTLISIKRTQATTASKVMHMEMEEDVAPVTTAVASSLSNAFDEGSESAPLRSNVSRSNVMSYGKTMNDLKKLIDVTLVTLGDLSKLEQNRARREDLTQKLNQMSSSNAPLKQSLEEQATGGDETAKLVLATIGEDKTTLVHKVATLARQGALPVKPSISSVLSQHQSMQLTISNHELVNQIAGETSMTAEKVIETVTTLLSFGAPTIGTVMMTAQNVSIPVEKVQQVMTLVTTLAPTPSLNPTITEISSATHVGGQAVKAIVDEAPFYEETGDEDLMRIANHTHVTPSSVREVIQNAKGRVGLPKASLKAKELATQLSIGEEKVQAVLDSVPAGQAATADMMSAIASQEQLTEETVHKIIASSLPPTAPSYAGAISLEEYEEVKQMWLTHYRGAPVPESESIHDRMEWLLEEIKLLTNVLNLLASSDPTLKQQGYAKVTEILPFMLLGGFSEAMILAYIKAKLEAAKQIISELTGNPSGRSSDDAPTEEFIDISANSPTASEEKSMQQEIPVAIKDEQT